MSLSKRILIGAPNVSGGGGGTPTVNVPTARFSEDASVGDTIALVNPRLSDDASVGDTISLVQTTHNDDVSVGETFSAPLIAPVYAETEPIFDIGVVRLINVAVARIGTPDNNPWTDSYTDQVLAATNFGAATGLQVKKSAPLANNEKIAYIALDLATVIGTGWICQNTGLLIAFGASTTLLALTQTLAWECFRSATKPFTESTVTWNTSPTIGTAVQNGTLAVSATTQYFTIIVSAANLQNCLGQWLLFRFRVTDIADLGIDTVTINSREAGTFFPAFAIDYLQMGG